MFTINKAIATQERCQKCQLSLLEHINSQIYCQQCNHFSTVIEQEIRVVPLAYQSNVLSKSSAKEKRINQFIKEFAQKYCEIDSLEQMGRLRDKVMQVQPWSNSKGYRESAAVVVFVQFRQQHKLSPAMFCKNNQIKAKAFNSKYKKYKEIFSAEESPGHLVKQENKIEDIYEDEEENEEGERDEESKDLNIPGSMITFAQSPKKSIDLVFTDFFNKYYFELNHELMVEQLADKMEEANNKIRKTHLTNGPNRIFYLLYAVLKDIGHRVTLKKYCQTISDRTGYHLTKRICSNLQKQYQEIKESEERTSESEVTDLKLENMEDV